MFAIVPNRVYKDVALELESAKTEIGAPNSPTVFREISPRVSSPLVRLLCG